MRSPLEAVRGPVRRRTTLAFGLIALLVSAFVAAVCFTVTRSTLVHQREDAAERQAFVNARAVRTVLRLADADPVEALGRAQTSGDGAGLVQVEGDWFTSAVGASRDDIPPALLAAADRGVAARQRIEWGGGTTVAVATPIADVGAVYVELVPMADVARTLTQLQRALVVAVVVATGLGSAAGWAASGRVLRPVRRMADAATQIRGGALDRRLAADGDADLEPLVDSFNDMVDALQQRIDREARFASDVSHEMRSPLATMAAALSVTRRRVDGQAGHDALDQLEQEVDRFGAMVTDLLEISRAEAGVIQLNLEEVAAAEFAGQVLRSTGNEHVPLVDRSEGARIALDKRRMAQAIANLLINADGYAGGATALTVEASADDVVFAVDDDGPGIPDHERAYVFERFARGSTASASGTGLGLALVQEHLRLHGGRADVGGAPGGGARFTLTLPRVP